MSCAEGVLGHVGPVNIRYSCIKTWEKPPQLVAVQEPRANEHWPDERFFGERLGRVTRRNVWLAGLYFQVGKITDNVMVCSTAFLR